MKRIIVWFLCAAMILCFGSCSKKSNDKPEGADKTVTESKAMPEVVKGEITFKEYGTMQFEIYPTKAPQSAYNFIHLAKNGFYDGLIVHRLIQDFVIQAGAYESGYVERASENKTIYGEFKENGFDNPIRHVRGTLSWARPNDFNAASTQFFICTGDELVKSLDGKYAAFGMVTGGFDVMDQINQQPTGNYDMPVNEIQIESVVILSDYEFPLPDYVG